MIPRKRFSNNVLRSDVRRPWGRKREKVFCYAVTLEALLKDAFPNKFLRRFRPSAFKLACNRLPVTVFEYTADMLRNAVADFEGPYGFVAK